MVSLTPSSTKDLFALPMALRRYLHKHAEVTETSTFAQRKRNRHIEYASSNAGAAHMCSLDGHVASIVGFAIVMQRPAYEVDFGAVKVIENVCLESVDEVYRD
ncbi:hypothetical protein SDRG_00503 [Saprolegnia diclina VS20]|uniref:Uncharacterized protein n=1 Tax=Saprolegnia diclina (strain VS20) TaxID=1156394 RepID=T0SIL2_SAPDV|nr:hypothetical protein SDRG_00503 [Saprolegnia diclina VS20]EQC42782.1 hypothetical protein SDRG_00503 [Saprolegnia diclina VS20]|eukprot:XP_008604205.1 hypothetical protein SDRG_00503 [Saprolegnia diclina VS20]